MKERARDIRPRLGWKPQRLTQDVLRPWTHATILSTFDASNSQSQRPSIVPRTHGWARRMHATSIALHDRRPLRLANFNSLVIRRKTLCTRGLSRCAARALSPLACSQTGTYQLHLQQTNRSTNVDEEMW